MRQFAVLNIVDYNDKRVTFTLLHCYPFVLLVCCFDVHIYITRSKHGIDSDLEGPAKKTRGPEDLEGPRNLLLISTLTPDHIDTICSGYVERHCMTQRTTSHYDLPSSSHWLREKQPRASATRKMKCARGECERCSDSCRRCCLKTLMSTDYLPDQIQLDFPVPAPASRDSPAFCPTMPISSLHLYNVSFAHSATEHATADARSRSMR